MSLGFGRAISLFFVGKPGAWMSSLRPWTPSAGPPTPCRACPPSRSQGGSQPPPLRQPPSPAGPVPHFSGQSRPVSGMEAEAGPSKGGSFRLSHAQRLPGNFLVVLTFSSACRVLEGSVVQCHCPGEGVQGSDQGIRKGAYGEAGTPFPHPTAIHQGSLGWAYSESGHAPQSISFPGAWGRLRLQPLPSLEPLAFTPAPALGSALGTSGSVPGSLPQG